MFCARCTILHTISSKSICFTILERSVQNFINYVSRTHKCGHLLQTQLYLYSKPNQLHNMYLKFILFWNNTLHVSDGLYVHRQESKTTYSIRYMSYRFCGCLLTSSRRRPERPSETCRVSFRNKINLRYCASGWFYYRSILQCTVLHVSNNCTSVIRQLHFWLLV